MKVALTLVVLLLSTHGYSQKNKIKIEYQKRQKIDLGALMIDGELVTPGDFTVDDEKEKATELLFKRKNYNDRLRINIEYVF
jgi:hypothetical protein